MKLYSAGADEVFDGIKHRRETGSLSRWRFRVARAVYTITLALLRKIAL
jgi:hypothetical protein